MLAERLQTWSRLTYQQRQADVSVAVDVVVDWHRANKRDLRRPHRVVLAEDELKLVLLACIQGARRSLDVHQPASRVVGRVQAHAIWWLRLERFDLLRQALHPCHAGRQMSCY